MTTDTAPPPPKPTRKDTIVTPDAKFFWDGANQEKLLGQRCVDCRQWRYPPRPMCPHCFSVKTEIAELSGRGTVYTWVRPMHPPPFGFKEPPTVAVIALEEGFRLVSNVVDIPFEQITAGLPVQVKFAPTMGNKKVPVFAPVGK